MFVLILAYSKQELFDKFQLRFLRKDLSNFILKVSGVIYTQVDQFVGNFGFS